METLTRKVYKSILKPLAFKRDPEETHNKAIKLGIKLGKSPLFKSLLSNIYNYENPILSQNLLGIKFKNPVGLSAGFDKNAELSDILPTIGFGFAELGSITAKPCSGNKGTRIKRLPNKESLWINLGLNNKGADKIYNSLKSISPQIPLGISIAKTNCKETVKEKVAISDYLYSIKKFANLKQASYLTINISCPNAYGGQPFSDPKLLSQLLSKVSALKMKKPIFIKISPDLDKKTIDETLKLAKKHKISGLICSNLTKKHKEKSGGLSGKPLEAKANNLISYIYKKTKGKFVIIGVGGIFSAEDAYKKIKLGASLVQLITGMIYEGPSLISEINRDLVNLLKKDGFKNISDAIGTAHKIN
tara:strand:+ start:899 stop:1981 length:1083 start_codon:yes stop_codon:yes gene_type:complete